jgi:hypothetical protein
MSGVAHAPVFCARDGVQEPALGIKDFDVVKASAPGRSERGAEPNRCLRQIHNPRVQFNVIIAADQSENY